MWRWIFGILALVVVVLMATCYAGYRKLTGGGDSVVMTVPGEPAATFTLLTDRDSLLAWLPEGSTVMPARRGSLQVGDTVRVAAPARPDAPNTRATQLWIIRDVKAPVVLAVEGIEFDPGGLPHPAYTRRDSLVAANDSTRIISTFVGVPMLTGSDSVRATSGAVTGSLFTAAERMRLAGARLMWQENLKRLVRHAQ